MFTIREVNEIRHNMVLLWAVLIIAAAASLWSTSGLLRKNDQATILAGAHDWARGERQPWSHYYQFDKTYVLYAYCAGVLKLNRLTGASIDPILLANRAVASAFWLALFVFVARYRRTLDPLVLFAVLAAPAILLNTQYVNSSTLSSAFLLLSVAAWPRKEWAAVFMFFAVGARADVVLLLPLLGWLVFQRLENRGQNFSNDWKKPARIFQRLEKHLRSSSNDWKTPVVLIVAALCALLLGRVWSDGAGAALDPFFNVKMALGYWVFGFGAASLLFLRVPLAWWRTNRSWWCAAGVLTFLLPLVFFLPQLHAPRYFWRACEALLIVSALSPIVVPRMLRRLVWIAAVLPLLVGVSLPTLRNVVVTTHEPTLFPSGDGHYPMGAYASFLHRFRHADAIPIDHNQRVWTAMRGADFEVSPAGTVPVMFSPMYGYFMLEASLRGFVAEYRTREEWGNAPFYVDSRTLQRADVKFAFDDQEDLLRRDIAVVSPDIDGIAVLHVGRGDGAWGDQTRLLNRLFAGNEYRIVSSGRSVPLNRKAVWFSDQPFPGALHDEDTGWYYTYAPYIGETIRIAYSALPSWMTVQAFAGE